MKIIKTKFQDLVLIKTNIYKDKRGFLKETYNQKLLKYKLVFDIMSVSKKNVLRGLHIQTKKPQAKYITVTNGKILDVVVDLRKKSKTFGKYFSIEISEESDFSLFVPEGFAHGFLCLSETCTVNYKCSQYRDKNSEMTLKWNDKKLGIKWPSKNPIISDKDKKGYSIDFFK
ncbi:dTDP-4-dehydrorhamnose 3,5-epimerase [Candidatus Pelagibacter communis]|uniref:dTDP-4-dehydrorhamnose 3,5-epimerase n=1 Tax=Candidatus Pelagibacter TaxID=198251 RepID=UPI003EE02D68